MFGVGLWGLHLGLTQGQLAALIADTTPLPVRGTAFGLFHFGSGIALLLASPFAGRLWELIGPSATFLWSAGFTAMGLIAAMFLIQTRQRGDEKIRHA